MADDACDHGEVLPSLKGECLCAAVARLGAEVAGLTQERADWKAIGKGMNRLAGVVSRIAGTLGLDPDESEEEEVEQRAKALRTLATQLVGALREIADVVAVRLGEPNWLPLMKARAALAAAEQAGLR